MGVGVGEMPEGRGGEEAKSPCWVRNVVAGGPLSRLETPGQVCAPVQNKEAARGLLSSPPAVAPALSSACKSPLLAQKLCNQLLPE